MRNCARIMAGRRLLMGAERMGHLTGAQQARLRGLIAERDLQRVGCRTGALLDRAGRPEPPAFLSHLRGNLHKLTQHRNPMTRRDWLILVAIVAGIQALQLGIWWWGYTASTTVPLDLQRPALVMLLGCVVFGVWAALTYLLTLHTLRTRPSSRLLGYAMLAAVLLPTIALAILARCGGPRFQPLVLQFPTIGCHIGWCLGMLRWQRGRSQVDGEAEQPAV